MNTSGFSKEQATLISFGAMAVALVFQPLLGAISDRVGRRPMLLFFGVAATLGTVPLLRLLAHTTRAGAAFGLLVAALFVGSAYTSISAVVKAELFPTLVRALGVGLPYALTVAIFGGTAEYLALFAEERAREEWFYWYVTGCALRSQGQTTQLRYSSKTNCRAFSFAAYTYFFSEMRFFSSTLLVAAVAGTALAFSAQTAQAQAQTTMAEPAQAKKPEDKSKRPSPPAVVKTTVRGTDVTIDYSRPSLKDRAVFGEKSPLAPVGEVWRTGANEATTFMVSKDVKIEGQALAAGTYSLFTIPGATEWTIIFNKTAKQWGAYDYKSAADALRVKVKPTTVATPVEQFTITADKSGKVTMAWGKTAASFMVK